MKGLRFEWDEAVDYTPEQQVAYETMVADRYEVDPQYFADKYSMPVGERRSYAMPDGGGDGGSDGDGASENDPAANEKEKDGKQQKNAHGSFFD